MMKVKEMKSILKSDKFDNCDCDFKITKGGHKTTLDDVVKAINNLDKKLTTRIDRAETSINSRIDHLVKVNKLKE